MPTYYIPYFFTFQLVIKGWGSLDSRYHVSLVAYIPIIVLTQIFFQWKVHYRQLILSPVDNKYVPIYVSIKRGRQTLTRARSNLFTHLTHKS